MRLEIAKEKFSKVLEVADKIKKYIVGDTQEKKLDIILNHLIDNIELRGDDVIITTKKNIAIQNEGHLVQINAGYHIMLSKEIHLNPRINFNTKSEEQFKIVGTDLKIAREREEKEFNEKLKALKEAPGCCQH